MNNNKIFIESAIKDCSFNSCMNKKPSVSWSRIFIEIRACAGGEEAEKFANEIMQVYLKYGRKNNLNMELINDGKTKILSFEGDTKHIDILKNEEGIHKVQRISKNKMHTSTISVVIMDVVNTNKFNIKEEDLLIESFRASGNGGQHRNTTDSAIRMIYKPTNLAVVCCNERSQYQNKITALELLKSKLYKIETEKNKTEENNKRKKQVKNGERAEARRTYNYIRNIVIDDKTNKSCTIKDYFDKCNLICLA